MTKIYKPHPAAELLPMMAKHQLRELADDIKKRGLIHPIVLFQNRVLDGRNRQAACRLAGVAPRFIRLEDETGDLAPAAYSRSANGIRRHLTKSQIAVYAVKLMPLFREQAIEKQRQAGRDSAIKRKGGTVAAPGPKVSTAKLAIQALSQGDIGDRTMRRAKAIQKADKKLFRKIWAGEATLKQAERQTRLKQQVAEAKAYVAPTGQFPVIVADFPWSYDDHLAGIERELPYPTMSLAQIMAYELPAARDCVLWLWVTNAHMRQAFDALDAWGFEAKTILTWAKDKFGLGRWLRGQTEHCILAIRGSPRVDLVAQSTLLLAPRRANSEKPAEFFALVESLCHAGPKLELFARAPRAGWVTSGSELAPLHAAAARGKAIGDETEAIRRDLGLAPATPSGDAASPGAPGHNVAPPPADAPFSQLSAPGTSQAPVDDIPF